MGTAHDSHARAPDASGRSLRLHALPATTLMVRLLYISACSPVPWKLGPARRNYHVIDQLSRRFELTVLAVATPAQQELFASTFGSRVHRAVFTPPPKTPAAVFVRKAWRTATCRADFLPAVSAGMRQECAALMAGSSFDGVVLSHVMLGSLPIPADMTVVGDTHNAEFDVQRRMSRLPEASAARRAYSTVQWRATRRAEQQCARRVDLLLATSERDAALFRDELGIAHTSVIANGIDLGEFARAPFGDRGETILFTGLMSYYPNQQGVRWLVDEVMPRIRAVRPQARLVVAGAAPPKWLEALAGPSLEVTGHVADMRPYLAEATVVVAPIWLGGGTRVKILEAMATGRPVVSTSVGCEGLGAVDGEAIRVADDPALFADRVVELLGDPGFSRRIADGGYRHVCEHFDWERLGEQLCARVSEALVHGARQATRRGNVR